MGILRFLVPRRDRLPETALERAYVTGLDEIPWVSRIASTDDGLIVDRPVSDSGMLHIPWKVDNHRETVLTTASLMERERPYLLEVELARGTVNRIRNQIAIWESAGMRVPETIGERLGHSIELFARAATSQHDPAEASRLAGEVLSQCMPIIVSLGASYSQQALALRHSTSGKLVTMVGANLGHTPLDNAHARIFLGAFNAAVVPLPWRQIEASEGKHSWLLADSQIDWCVARGLRMCSEPLIQFDGTDAPDWLYLWEEDADNLMTFMTEYLRAVVARYKSRFQVWQCAGRVNTGSFLGLSAHHKMQMALRAVEIVREEDPNSPVVLTLDQPWGEYISRQEADLPLHLADMLLRSGLQVSGFALELNVGYYPGGTQQRNLLEFSRQLDRWSMLGMPLLVSLVVPSANGEDPKAQSTKKPVSEGWTPAMQEEWVREFVPVILSKNVVQGVFWNQFRDSEPHEFSHGGLIDPQSRPKPALTSLAHLRHSHVV
jgi:hypothetical protein